MAEFICAVSVICNYILYYSATLHSIIIWKFSYGLHLINRSDQQFAIGLAAADNFSAARPIFDSINWTEENSREFERIGQTAEQEQMCISTSRVNMYSTAQL